MTVWGLAGANSNSIFCDAGRFAIQLMYVWSPTCFRLAPLARLKSLPSPLPPLLSIRGFPASSLGDLRSPLTNTYHVCRGKLQSYAFRKGLTLEIWLPTRPKVRGAGNVAPKTAMRTSIQTRVPGWHLELYRPKVDKPCCGQGKQKHGWGTG